MEPDFHFVLRFMDLDLIAWIAVWGAVTVVVAAAAVLIVRGIWRGF